MQNTLLSSVPHTRHRFAELDVLRGFAALAVVIYHYSTHCVRYGDGFPFVFAYGKYGVHLFFTISGFVIYYTLQKTARLGDFAFSRFSRLFPAYWATLALLALVDLAGPQHSLWVGGYLANATMLQKFLGFKDIEVVFWTLGVEIVFYALVAVMFVLGGRQRILSYSLFWLGIVTGTDLLRTAAGAQLPDWLDSLLLVHHAPYFIAGVAFYMMHSEGIKNASLTVVICALASIALTHGHEELMVSMVIFAIFAAALGGLLRAAVNDITLWLGAISYTLYLTHYNLGNMTLFRLYEAGVPAPVAFLVVTVAALALATLMTKFIEQPAMDALRQWHAARAKRTPATVRGAEAQR